MTAYKAGLSGEARAEQYLTGQGMTVLARRYRGQDGEIDLVMDDGGVIVFVEVKSRPASSPGEGLAAVSRGKQLRLIHAAEAYLYDRDETGAPVRFDVVELSAGGILHVRDAFQL